MMGCADQVHEMSLFEYEQRLFHWNEAHDTSDVGDFPDPVTAMRILERANSNPALVN